MTPLPAVVAGNKIRLVQAFGQPGPCSGLAGRPDDGSPIMESDGCPGFVDWPSSPTRNGLLPLGSTRESGSHKGYGLSCVVDILTGILSGTGYGMVPGRPNFNHFVAAYSIEAFTEVDQFKDLMDDFLRALRTTPPAPGHDRVLYAGLPEWEAEQDRG